MSFLYRWISPLYDAFFCPSLPFTIRWRLVAFQPLVFLTNTIQYFQGSTLLSKNPETVIWIPLKRSPGHSVRAIVYHRTGRISPSEKRPLHLNIHGGGFLGGLPEGNAPFCRKFSAETGAVVVSTSYRYAPRYTFPIAHEDVQDVADWLIQNAEKLLGADPTLMSVSGFSVGGNLVLGIAQRLSRSEFRIKAAVLFYTPVGDP
jgi:acetyl esterase/lipase